MNSRGCHQCRANTYSGDGANRCTSCPVGKISAPGSTSVYDCRYGGQRRDHNFDLSHKTKHIFLIKFLRCILESK